MNYTAYDLLWLFLIYSVLGWGVGTAAAAIRKRKFIDVGFLYGPWCPAYGFGGIAFAVLLTELRNDLPFLFLGGMVVAFLVTYMTGGMLEYVFHRKWWDYSRKRFQFGGRVNLPYVVVWGVAAIGSICFFNPLLMRGIAMLPRWAGDILLPVIYVVLFLDFVGTVSGVLAAKSKLRKSGLVGTVSESLQKQADFLGEGLTGFVLRHFGNRYPELKIEKLLEAELEREKRLEEEKEKAGRFAVGCGFYKLVSLFFIGAFLGDVTETIFCLVTSGRLMSRSSVVYGPFSIVWGLGAVFLTMILYQYRNKSDSFIFVFGTVLGGAYEYACSVFTELVFGTVFWDYSKIPFNLGGRINLLYCFFWGIVAVVWMRALYPRLSDWIEKIPKKAGETVTWVLVAFMIFNILMSGMAIGRYTERHTREKKAGNAVEEFLDDHFPDERMERIYPNAKVVE